MCVHRTLTPLVLRDEIYHVLQPAPARHYESLPAHTQNLSLDRIAELARGMYPGQIIISIFADDDEPQVYVHMAPSWEILRENHKASHFIRFDARTSKVLGQSKPPGQQRPTILDRVMRSAMGLHIDLFAGLPGELFLGFVGLLFVVATVSGVVLYGPFMKKLEFGVVRADRSSRLKWLDLHNLLGIVTLAWVVVVGATGIMNELSTPLFAIWQRTDVKAVLAPWQGKPVPAQTELSSVQAAFDTARRAAPGMTFTSINYPGSRGGSPYHYLLWGHGDTPLTSRLFTPVLVDASTGALTAVIKMPWYLRILEVSRPLHFGDYGGLPLKIIWAVLDLLTIIVLGSGLYLWIARRRQTKERLEKLIVAHGDRLLGKAPS